MDPTQQDDDDLINMTLDCLLSRSVLEKIKAPSPKHELDLTTYRAQLEATLSHLLTPSQDTQPPQHIKDLFANFVTACNEHYRQTERYHARYTAADDEEAHDPRMIRHQPTIDYFMAHGGGRKTA